MSKDYTEFPEATSEMLQPRGRGMWCFKCMGEYIEDYHNLEKVEDICRHLGIAFFPDEWIRLAEEWKIVPTRHYFNLYADLPMKDKTDWRSTKELWKKKIETGTVGADVDALREIHHKEMEIKWRGNYSYEDYLWLEEYENSMMASYVIEGREKIDRLRKLCKLSLQAEMLMDSGEDSSKVMKSYNDILKASNFDEHIRNNQGMVTSISEMCKVMEDQGFRPSFHNSTPKDIVDYTIKDMQEFNKRLIAGEPTIQDEVAAKLKKAELNVKTAEEKAFEDMGNELGQSYDAENEIKVEEAPLRSEEEKNKLIDRLAEEEF